MITTGVAALAFTLVLATLGLYLRGAIHGERQRIQHSDDYFLAKNSTPPDDFGNAQIAYALQMGTVYPFFVLAFIGAWLVPVLNTLFWAVGILLLYLLIPRFSTTVTSVLGSSGTIHSFIADAHDAPYLRPLASGLSIIGFLGLLAFEIVWGAGVFRVLFQGNQAVFYLALAVLSIYLLVYLWQGGHLSSLRTDQFQLVIAYVALHLAVCLIVGDPAVDVSALPIPWLPLLVVVLSVIMLILRAKRLWAAVRPPQNRFVVWLYPVIIASLLLMLVALLQKPGLLSSATTFHLPEGEAAPDIWMLATACCLPLFWQIVDLTNWQRIASLTAMNPQEYQSQARLGLKSYLLESPLSWLLPILLGASAAVIVTVPEGVDPFDGFLTFLLAGGSTLRILTGCLFCAGIIAIFTSTADALICAIGYAYAYDIAPMRRAGRSVSTDPESTIATGRRFMAVALGAVIFGFIALDLLLRSGQELLGVFFAFFTPMVAFSPAILVPALTGRRAPSVWATLSIACGAVAGVGIGIYSVFSNPDLQWRAAPISFAIAWVFYLLGFLAKRIQVEARDSDAI